MKAFVTGATGQLGHDVVCELAERGYQVIGSGSRPNKDVRPFEIGADRKRRYDCANAVESSDVDGNSSITHEENNCAANGKTIAAVPYVQLNITEQKAVKETVEKINPDVVIHCAAWTAVDGAENQENKAKVYVINHLGTQYLAEAAKAVDAKMIYISTDYVFDGQGERPWQPDDKNYAPLNVYGASKLAGEQAVSSILDKFFIVRTAWVFGLNGKNFIKTMISIGKKNDTVRVVSDQIGTPTYTKDLARLLVDMAETDRYGYYHATNEGGFISWYDFCCEFYKQYGLNTKVIPVTTAEYGQNTAARPANSRLDKSKLVAAGFQPLPTWQNAVCRYLKEANL